MRGVKVEGEMKVGVKVEGEMEVGGKLTESGFKYAAIRGLGPLPTRVKPACRASSPASPYGAPGPQNSRYTPAIALVCLTRNAPSLDNSSRPPTQPHIQARPIQPITASGGSLW